MRRSDTSNSIMMLKHKFDEIKQNINNIEERQREFFSKSPHVFDENNHETSLISARNRALETKHTERPASATRFAEGQNERMKEIENNNRYLMRMVKALEQDKHELANKLDNLHKENEKLKEELTIRNSRITNLTSENSQLKSRVEASRNISPMRSWETNTRHFSSEIKERPQSCIRTSTSSPKKQRVAFSKDLVKIVHIDGDEAPRSIEKSKEITSGQARYSSPRKDPFNSTQPIERYNELSYHSPAPRYKYDRENYKPIYTSLQDKRALLNRLSSEESDKNFSDYYRERSRAIAQRMMEMD